MPRRIAIINYDKCVPEECRDGICSAIKACKKKVIRQEEPYEIPYINTGICIGCYDCIPFCHREAIEKAR
ncbi:MAG: hypothetical protein U9O59_03840 [Actinomycetota bacterium]|nr:hypothetical protein [Actinomycetota bacterium]